MVRCEALRGFEKSLGNDQGDEHQGDEHLANAAAGGGGFVFHGW